MIDALDFCNAACMPIDDEAGAESRVRLLRADSSGGCQCARQAAAPPAGSPARPLNICHAQQTWLQEIAGVQGETVQSEPLSK